MLTRTRTRRFQSRSAGKRRKENSTDHGKQPGDPAKAGDVLVDVVESGKAPYLLMLGSDASDAVRLTLDKIREELDAWEVVGRSTDFGGGGATHA